MLKKSLTFGLLLLCLFLVSCKNQVDYSKSSIEPPDLSTSDADYKLDFIVMHNYVIESIQSEVTPFFYILKNEFDIDGNNEEKIIEVKCKCMDGCVKNDIDLFFSMVLNYIAINAAEQDYRFKTPSVSNDGTYLDYGNVFETYSLKLYAETESGEIIYDTIIKNGDNIPIDPRYIKES